MTNHILLAALLVLLARPAAAAEPSWRATYDALAKDPAQARTAFDFLLRQPLEAKTTVDFHVALAHAARGVQNVLWASRAMMVLREFLKPAPMPDVSAVTHWLSERGLVHHRAAREALARGDDKTAAKEYLVAVRCDHAVLGFADRGLQDSSYSVLDGLVQSHSTQAEYYGHKAFYAYYFGKLADAKQALTQGIALQTDPYLKWIYQQGMKMVDEQLAKPKSDQGKGGTSPSPAPASPAPRAAPAHDEIALRYAEQRQKAVHADLERVQRLLELDARARRPAPQKKDEPPAGGPTAVERYKRLKEHLKTDLKSSTFIPLTNLY